MSNQKNKIRAGITHGDPNGVGYEVILKALDDPRMPDLFTPVVYGSGKIANHYRKSFEGGGQPAVPFQRIDKASDARDGSCNIINVIGEDFRLEPGKASAEAGAAAFTALEAAVADLREGRIDVLVTAPIDKHSIQSPTFSFPGHTEYLEASLAGDAEADEKPAKALMVMATAEGLRVALATTHKAIAEIPSALTKDLILEKLEAFDRSLRRDFGVHQPRIAVLALNPHAGEQGLLGKEEAEVIEPAIAEARERNIQAFGPYAADGFFGAGHHKSFDGILAMYHDQGLAPFKTLAMDAGVNVTAGLPYVRTSPDHGTGYDIAGKGVASEASMRNAMYMALDIFRNRRCYDEAHSNPLRRQYHNKGKDSDI
ncbi:MAG: 4-hydroxythreonine-4-phosphate dehydrogenase PdxA [Muribaculaceae bacterium]|nr:4-hydroxythreonine-4-phosphate dehydrogenase PdxA [Muribaculaceae bacterium]